MKLEQFGVGAMYELTRVLLWLVVSPAMKENGFVLFFFGGGGGVGGVGCLVGWLKVRQRKDSRLCVMQCRNESVRLFVHLQVVMEWYCFRIT